MWLDSHYRNAPRSSSGFPASDPPGPPVSIHASNVPPTHIPHVSENFRHRPDYHHIQLSKHDHESSSISEPFQLTVDAHPDPHCHLLTIPRPLTTAPSHRTQGWCGRPSSATRHVWYSRVLIVTSRLGTSRLSSHLGPFACCGQLSSEFTFSGPATVTTDTARSFSATRRHAPPRLAQGHLLPMVRPFDFVVCLSQFPRCRRPISTASGRGLAPPSVWEDLTPVVPSTLYRSEYSVSLQQ